jgi:hypothetical protein
MLEYYLTNHEDQSTPWYTFGFHIAIPTTRGFFESFPSKDEWKTFSDENFNDKDQIKQIINTSKKADQLIQSIENIVDKQLRQHFERNILKTKPEAIDGIFDSIVKAGDKPTVVAKTVKEIDTLTQLKDPTGKALLSTAEANTLKDTLKGQFLKNLSGAATEADPVYGALYSADKFASYLNKFRLTKDKIFTKGELKSFP